MTSTIRPIMIEYAHNLEQLKQLASEHSGERILQVVRSRALHTKGVVLYGICGEDWEYYSFWIKLESGFYLSLSTSFDWGIRCHQKLDEEVFPVETMSDWIVDSEIRLMGIHIHDYDDGDGPMVEFELSEGLLLWAYNTAGGTCLDLFRAAPMSEGGTRVMNWPRCAG